MIRVGVLTDLSGPYRDINGPNGIAATRQAAAEFMAANPGIKVEVIAADHQNKPDVGVGILRGWYDREDVDMVTDLTNSAVALACNNVSAEKNKVCIVTAGGTSALTGPACTANLVHWTYDSWNLAHSTGDRRDPQRRQELVLRHAELRLRQGDPGGRARFVEAAGGRCSGTPPIRSPRRRIFPASSSRRRAAGPR